MGNIKKQMFASSHPSVKVIKSPKCKVQRKRSAINIQKVQILPNVQDLLTTFEAHKATEIDIESAAKTPKARRASTSKRCATSPLAGKQSAKRVNKELSERKLDAKGNEAPEILFKLSKDDMNFLQRDIKSTRINVNILPNELMPMDDMTPDQTPIKANPKAKTENVNQNKLEEKIQGNEQKAETRDIVEELLQQVEEGEEFTKDEQKKGNEAKPSKQINKGNEQASSSKQYVADYNFEKDLELLSKFGLEILIHSDAEDFHVVEEIEKMRFDAEKFAKIFKNYPFLLYSYKSHQMGMFNNLCSHLNRDFKENVSINDVKRIINRLVIWYTNCSNTKMLQKKFLSESTNHYVLLFNYIPKTGKRIYYCEFCEDNFNSEIKYYKHRMIHTGALFPFMCNHCPKGFQSAISLKRHSVECLNMGNRIKIEQEKNKLKETKKIVKSIKVDVPMPESLPPNSIYKCVKCKAEFNNEIIIKRHINICNNFPKSQLTTTPRPK